jgi:hypothetical protein
VLVYFCINKEKHIFHCTLFKLSGKIRVFFLIRVFIDLMVESRYH